MLVVLMLLKAIENQIVTVNNNKMFFVYEIEFRSIYE